VIDIHRYEIEINAKNKLDVTLAGIEYLPSIMFMTVATPKKTAVKNVKCFIVINFKLLIISTTKSPCRF
jgi:hypothetical protein